MNDEARKHMARNVLRGHMDGYEEGHADGIKWLADALLSQAAVKAANDALYGSPTGGVRKALEAAVEAAVGELR